MLTFKDIAQVPGVCWRFCGRNPPDTTATFNTVAPPLTQDEAWDCWDLTDVSNDYLKVWCDQPIELLEDVDTTPTPTLRKLPGFYTSKCGGYVIVAAHSVPAKCIRSLLSTTFDEAVRDEERDLAAIEDELAWGPAGKTTPPWYCWVRLADLGITSVARSATAAVPAVLAATTPPDDALGDLLVSSVDGLRGAACVLRYEMAQRTESLARTGAGMVSTNAACALNARQVAHAQRIWPLMLRAKLNVAAVQEHNRVTCEDQDEMPNMEYVGGE